MQSEHGESIPEIQEEDEQEEEHLCSLCMEPLTQDYGYVAYVQKSKVLDKLLSNVETLTCVSDCVGMHV
jgi:hypothetical protein